jgi:hypothetical protein
MKSILTLGEKLYISYNILFVICVLYFKPEVSIIKISLSYILVYCIIIVITVLIIKNNKYAKL